MAQEYFRRTGITLSPDFEFSDLFTHVDRARRKALADLARGKQSRVLGSKLLDRYFGGMVRACERLLGQAY